MTTPPTKQGVRRMYAIEYNEVNLSRGTRKHKLCVRHTKDECREEWDSNTCYPVAVVSLEQPNIDALVERAAEVIKQWEVNRYGRRVHIAQVTPLLAAAVVRALLRLPLPKGREG